MTESCGFGQNWHESATPNDLWMVHPLKIKFGTPYDPLSSKENPPVLLLIFGGMVDYTKIVDGP